MSGLKIRRGFTLVELLVVIAIIGILVALLLPAVQAAREAARRMSCGNNLKQIALGLHNYHDAYKTFPPDAIWHGNPQGVTATAGHQRNYTWITLALPYIEQAPLHGKINFNFPALQQFDSLLIDGKPARGMMLEVLQCPSDYYWDAPPRGFGTTSYAGSSGWDHHRRKTGDLQRAGVFPLYDAVKIADIQDGTSFTAMLAETTTLGYCCRPTGVHRSVGGAGVRRSTNQAVARGAFVASGAWHGFNHAWVLQEGKGEILRADGSAGSMAAPNLPYWQVPHISPPLYWWHHAINNDWVGPASSHPGGAQFALADGSVRMIVETISVGNAAAGGNDENLGWNGNIWASLHNIAGHPNDVPVVLP
jgi:prepilin-type N-terminal cleavage/methylation domain-containing protein/prepilin-type processing-associated H-X9-DG protein